MKLLKYVAKLRKMSSEEILFRLRQTMRNNQEQFRWKVRGGSVGHDLFVPSELRNWQAETADFPDDSLQFYALSGDRDRVRRRFRKEFPEQFEQAIADADELLAHRFHLLGLEVSLPDPLPWNHNPQTGEAYPLVPHTMVDTFNTKRYGDVKYVWELNRHQFFIEVAKAYFLTGEPRYAEKIWYWLEAWFTAAPHKIGINHTSVLEHAVRIFSWLWAFYFTRDAAVWTAERRSLLAQHLLLQGEMIEENLSYYYSPYNHLIGELAALAFVGTVFPGSDKLRRWRDHYWTELEIQVARQFHTDGFTVEQASYYHHFTLGFYLKLAILRRQNGLAVSSQTWSAIERSLQAPLHLIRPDGLLPMIGDIDGARSIYFYRPRSQWDLRPFLAIGAVLFQRKDMKAVCQTAGEETLWLLGEAGLDGYEDIYAESPPVTQVELAESGYTVMRSAWTPDADYCCFDCGEIAHGVFPDDTPSAAHGHGDILSFELAVAGQPLVIDPGFHTYFGDLHWHRYFRSTRGHNGIELNGCGQAKHDGRIGWSHAVSPQGRIAMERPGLMITGGGIDRFSGLGVAAKQHRYIIFRPQRYLAVLDAVNGEPADAESLQIESSLHFAPGDLRADGNTIFFNDRLAALFCCNGKAEVHIACGGDGPDQGWMAEGYGKKTPAPVLRLRASQALPFYSAILFPLGETRQAENPAVRFNNLNGDVVSYDLELGDWQETIYLNPLMRHFSPASATPVESNALLRLHPRNVAQENEIDFVKLNHLCSVNYGIDFSNRLFSGLTLRVNGADKADVITWDEYR